MSSEKFKLEEQKGVEDCLTLAAILCGFDTIAPQERARTMGCGSSKDIGTSGQPPRSQQQQQQNRGPQSQSQSQPQPQQQQQQNPPSQIAAPAVQLLSSPGVWPKVVRLRNSSFTVTIHTHAVTSPPNQLPCWTYISNGLSEVQQPEVVFTLLQRKNENVEAYPEAPLEWIQTVSSLANAGLKLQPGQMVDLVFDKGMTFLKINNMMMIQENKNWQNMNRFGGLVLANPLTNSTLGLPQGTLPQFTYNTIALTREEAVVARQFGITRVIGHVGIAVRWFPYPPWIDRDREDTVNMADQAGSIRSGLPMARMVGLNVMDIEGDIIFTILEDEKTRKAFKDYVLGLPVTAAACFEGFMSEDAEGGRLWKTGQTKPMAYGDGSKMGPGMKTNLAFISFAPEMQEDKSIMVEDGCGIILHTRTWETIRNAIQNMQDITIPLADDVRFILKFARNIYHNPIDGSEHKAQWRKYEPQGPSKPPSNSHIQQKEIVFLVEPPSGTVSVQELSEFISKILKIIEQNTPVNPLQPPPGSSHPGRQMVVEIDLPKHEGWLKMTAYPSMDGINSQVILPQIAALRAPEARSRCKFQIFFDLWGYQGPSAQFS